MLKRTTPLKPKGKHKSAAVKRHHDRVARRGCCVCGGEATVHHVTSTRFGPVPLAEGPRRCDWRVVPLCPTHHLIQHGPFQSVEALGHGGFYEEWGIDLFALANELRAESEEAERRAA